MMDKEIDFFVKKIMVRDLKIFATGLICGIALILSSILIARGFL